jgi:hypothetical protein
MKRIIIISLFFLSLLNTLSAQGDISDDKKALIRNEQSFSIMLNSNGWGGSYTYGKMRSVKRKQLWNFELVSIKDPKEYKISHPLYPDKRRFVFGKTNDFFNFRFGYGQLITLFDKKDKGGIGVRCYYHVGILGGFLKPVYYIFSNIEDSTIIEKKFDSSIHDPYSILGGSSFFKGFDEFAFVPGAYAKLGASFEFGRRELILNALEGGLSLDVFSKKIDLMANNQNQFLFFSIFASYRFGKIINPRAILIQESKKNSE